MSSSSPPTIVERFIWRCRTVEVSFNPTWCVAVAIAHMEVRCIEPDRGPLPITETGYRSRFMHPDDVAEFGGPAEFVRAWLDHEAQFATWRETEAAWNQLKLF